MSNVVCVMLYPTQMSLMKFMKTFLVFFLWLHGGPKAQKQETEHRSLASKVHTSFGSLGKLGAWKSNEKESKF